MNKAYKILKKGEDGRLFSSNQATTDEAIRSGASIEYKLNEIVKPKIKGTKLFILNDLDGVHKAFEKYSNFCIYEVAVPKIYKIYGDIPEVYPDTFAGFWKDGKLTDSYLTYKLDYRDSIRLCDSLVLLKEILI